jgi:predicted nuclease of restriction endonuclease-like RecB superfamily
MLTANLVKVRFFRGRVLPRYIEADDATWLAVAERLLELFRGQEGRTRGDLDEDLKEACGDDPGQTVHQGLAKLLEDRCEFEVVSSHPPDQLRELVFHAATESRRRIAQDRGPRVAPFDRGAVLQQVAAPLGLTPDQVAEGLFADLKSEQRLTRFKDISAERLLQRYNVALAQAVLLRSVQVQVTIHNEPPQRFRQLLRLVKFHRLVCEVQRKNKDSIELTLDGPLSLFSATQKYGLQLALFLPAVLLCRDFELRADLRWGPKRRPALFELSRNDRLVSHLSETGMYVPPELAMFTELFRRKVDAWDIAEETEVLPLGQGFWVPDFRLTHLATGERVYLEVLGFWRRSSAEKHLERLRQHAGEPFLLAVSDQLRIDDAELEGLPGGICRFRNLPLPEEVARLAEGLLSHAP